MRRPRFLSQTPPKWDTCNVICQTIFTWPKISEANHLMNSKKHGLHSWSNMGRVKEDLESIQDRKGPEQQHRYEEVCWENPLSTSRARSFSSIIPRPKSGVDSTSLLAFGSFDSERSSLAQCANLEEWESPFKKRSSRFRFFLIHLFYGVHNSLVCLIAGFNASIQEKTRHLPILSHRPEIFSWPSSSFSRRYWLYHDS